MDHNCRVIRRQIACLWLGWVGGSSVRSSLASHHFFTPPTTHHPSLWLVVVCSSMLVKARLSLHVGAGVASAAESFADRCRFVVLMWSFLTTIEQF